MKKAITIKSIAEALNLSRNTVSKALNGQYVPEKTRELVLSKAQELNYKSLNSANLVFSDKKYRILLVSARPLNNINFYISLISSIENYCFERNYEFFQYIFNNKKNSFTKFSDYVKELNVDGIVALECFDRDFISNLLKLNIPICFHDFSHTAQNNYNNYDIICTNDEQSILNYVKYLHKKYNLNRYTFVGDNKHCHSFRKRYTGMLIGLKNLRIFHSSSEDITLSENNFNYGDTQALQDAISKLDQLPEVFVCCNDFVARNVCLALKNMNKEVPNDVLVVGFDNSAEAYSLSPTLTTFSLDPHFLGSEILRTLINRIDYRNIPSRFINISTDLISRESTERKTK
ncbi:MAG: LacI family transcriptional regulator [Anaeroplasmataceae bacterium]|nr:LacI family transcriptional regulator [Anaeroplasmataceae bacterium]